MRVILDHPPVPPTVYGEITLCFAQDFPVESLDSIIGLPASRSQSLHDTRINPVTKQHNPGYWSYRTKAQSAKGFDCTPLFDSLAELISTHEAGLRQTFTQYGPYDFIVRIYIDVQEQGEYPAIAFPPLFLKQLSELAATLEVIVTDCYERSGEERTATLLSGEE